MRLVTARYPRLPAALCRVNLPEPVQAIPRTGSGLSYLIGTHSEFFNSQVQQRS